GCDVLLALDDHGTVLEATRETSALSFRDGPKDQTRNLEIPGSALSGYPGMTVHYVDRQFSFSIATAPPWPTPTHMVASASLPPRFSMPWTAVSARRAPLMPRGWPSAMAPPCGLTKSASS